MKRFIIFLLIIWAVLFLLYPGYASGFLTPTLLFIIFGGSDEPNFRPLHAKHADINEVMKKEWFQKLMLRESLKPKGFFLFWLFVFLLFSITPGVFLGLRYIPSEFSTLQYSLRMAWWIIFTPIMLLSFGIFVIENFYEQILATPFLYGIPIAVCLGGLGYQMHKMYGYQAIILMIAAILIPFFLVDIARSLRKYYFPESYGKL